MEHTIRLGDADTAIDFLNFVKDRHGYNWYEVISNTGCEIVAILSDVKYTPVFITLTDTTHNKRAMQYLEDNFDLIYNLI